MSIVCLCNKCHTFYEQVLNPQKSVSGPRSLKNLTFWKITKSRTDGPTDRPTDGQHLRIKSPSRRLKMRYHSEIRGTYSTKCQKLFFFGNGWVPLNTITSILAVWIDYLCFTNDVFLIFLSWFGLVREILFPQRHNYLSLRTIHHSTLLLCAWTHKCTTEGAKLCHQIGPSEIIWQRQLDT